MASITITPGDDILRRFGNQIGAIGQGEAHKALARAINRTTVTVHGRVIKAIVKQSSIPRAIVERQVHRKLARVREGSVLEGVVFATGRPISLKYFSARQLSFGVRAKVQGEWRRYPGAFMGPRPGVLAPRLGGHAWVRTSKARLPIEKLYGPSVPEELVRGLTARVFEETVAEMLPRRVGHELGRLLPQ